MKILLALFVIVFHVAHTYKLKKVVILSRHNLRAPLNSNVEKITPKPWPQWKVEAGALTHKGAKLEGYWGKYFKQWFKDNGLLSGNCLDQEQIFVHANSKDRARASAEAFVNKAFKDCPVIFFSLESGTIDPVFNAVVYNETEIYKQNIEEEMAIKIASLNMTEAYIALEEILDFNHSRYYIEEGFCSLLGETKPLVVVGEEPAVIGPLEVGDKATDAFLMAYYEGFEEDQIAWGLIESTEQFKTFVKFHNEHMNVRFTTSACKETVQFLLQNMTDILLDEDFSPDISLFFGHDSNMASVTACLDFEEYELPEQFELTPIGGKLVFEKWLDESGAYYLRVLYYYMSMAQVREGSQFSSSNEPFKYTMRLKNCITDKNGFCPWENFVEILEKIY